jgi:hypothetical protein
MQKRKRNLLAKQHQNSRRNTIGYTRMGREAKGSVAKSLGA